MVSENYTSKAVGDKQIQQGCPAKMEIIFKRKTRITYIYIFPAHKFHADLGGKTSQSWSNKMKRKEIKSGGKQMK